MANIVHHADTNPRPESRLVGHGVGSIACALHIQCRECTEQRCLWCALQFLHQGRWSGGRACPLHGNYVHRFKTGLMTTMNYACTLTIPGDRAFKALQVFADAQNWQKFVDKQCGGRHCFWKVQDDGIYLYQIHQGQYIKRYAWDHV